MQLKADEWRTLCTTTFPISLVQLWSSQDNKAEHLEMSICLFSAVIIACSRVTSLELADQYMHYMERYRYLRQKLFPSWKAKPNDHMALHIGEFLRLYGPVHSWWTFPIERMIGSLQKVSTNYIPGAVFYSFKFALIVSRSI